MIPENWQDMPFMAKKHLARRLTGTDVDGKEAVESTLSRLAEENGTEGTWTPKKGRNPTELNDPTSRPPERGKTRAVWEPQEMLGVRDKDPNFEYRWETNDSAMQAKRRAEGWEVCSGLQGRASGSEKPITTIHEYRELILMRMPKDLRRARAEYYREQTEGQYARLQKEMEGERPRVASNRGKIVID